jgi:hypothetical protein
MKWLLFVLVLRPLIWINYRQRMTGAKPDRWYWADSLAFSWSYTGH